MCLHGLFSSPSEFYHCYEKVANTVSVGTYTIGFATSVSDLMQVIFLESESDLFKHFFLFLPKIFFSRMQFPALMESWTRDVVKLVAGWKFSSEVFFL